MLVAPIPENEIERLQELYEYKILDTPCEEIFDIITQLTAAICDSPMSTITLIDSKRQWIKSAHGLIVNESPREHAFCSYTILQSSLLEVLDAKVDQRFADNPFVTGNPHIRFYAGFSLISPRGLNIGSLCVIDTKPKRLTETQKLMLEKLSQIVINLLEARKSILHDITEKTEMARQLHEKVDEQKFNIEFNTQLSEMNSLLQSCDTFEDAYIIIKKFCEHLIPQSVGALYILNNEQEYADCVLSWNNTETLSVFSLQDCWALRRGHTYFCEDPETDLTCKHMTHLTKLTPYICIPLTAQIETLGVLSIKFDSANTTSHLSINVLPSYAQRMGEQITLSLANIKLRQKLRQQSIYDVLTGLYNRRYMEEVIHKEIALAQHNHYQLGFAIIDIDYFKIFNDKYGHDAGDVVLVEVAKLLKSHITGNNIPFRLGGEEFLIMLPDVTLDKAESISELLRSAVKKMLVQYGEVKLNQITFSIGLAQYPDDGLTASELLNNADKALYQAKEQGRDQVVHFKV